MTVILLVLNLILNTATTIVTDDSGRANIEASCDFLILDESEM